MAASFKIHFIHLEMQMDRPYKSENISIHNLSIWPSMPHPWFPTKKASKLTFVCFQHQVLDTMQGLNNWSWKQTYKGDFWTLCTVTFWPSAYGDTPSLLRHADILNGWSLNLFIVFYRKVPNKYCKLVGKFKTICFSA